MSRRIEIKAGDKYNRFTIIEEAQPYISPGGMSHRKMLCKCDCGNIKEVVLDHL